MENAIVLGVVATIVALIGLLGRAARDRATPAQLVVMTLPLGIIAGGYTASLGASLPWVLLAAVSALLAVLAGTFVGRSPALADQQVRPAAAGLSLAFGGLIALGMAAIVILWAGQIIRAMSNLNSYVVAAVLVLAAVAFGIGGRSAVGLSRLVLGLLIAGAVLMLALGAVAGDPASIVSAEVPVPTISPISAIVYAIAVILIGAGLPVLREGSHGNRRAAIVAAVVLALLVVVAGLGMLALYGGAYDLPSLVINIFPEYTPSWLAAIVCGLVAIVSTVTAGASINEAAKVVASVVPSWYEDVEHRLGPRRHVAFVCGLMVLIIVWLAPPPTAIVAILGVMGAANLITEWVISKGIAQGDRARSAQGPASSSESVAAGEIAGD